MALFSRHTFNGFYCSRRSISPLSEGGFVSIIPAWTWIYRPPLWALSLLMLYSKAHCYCFSLEQLRVNPRIEGTVHPFVVWGRWPVSESHFWTNSHCVSGLWYRHLRLSEELVYRACCIGLPRKYDPSVSLTLRLNVGYLGQLYLCNSMS